MYTNLTPLLGFLTRRPKVCMYHWWDTLAREQHRELTKPSTCQIKCPRAKDGHAKETWSIPNQTNGKANLARSKQIFLFQKILYMFYSEKSFHSDCIPSNTYLFTSNMSNTKLYYGSVFTLFKKRNTDDLTLLSCRIVRSHLRTQKACPMENICQKAESHCSHHYPEDPERNSEKFP